MLFSGMGDIQQAQETLSVGVGALAGSTIMLLTIPWSMSVLVGRVDIRSEQKGDGLAYQATPKLTAKEKFTDHLFKTGVSLSSEVRHGGIVMIITTIPYLIIQLPASFLHGPSDVVAKGEKWWALLGLLVCVAAFTTYLAMHVIASKNDEEKTKRLEVIKDMLSKGSISLSGAFYDIIKAYGGDEGLSGQDQYGSVSNGGRQPPPLKIREYLAEILKEPFKHYDTDNSMTLKKSEVRLLSFGSFLLFSCILINSVDQNLQR
jgi:Ca2+/Na+ antiporter